MTAGQIGLVPNGTTWDSRTIEWVTLSDVHHVYIDIGDGQALHVNPPRARIIDMADTNPATIWSRQPFTPEQGQRVADWARAREGRPYNYLADAVIAASRLFHWTPPRWVADRISSDKSYQCAQLADAAWTLAAPMKVFDDGRSFGMVAPGDLEILFKQNGWWPPNLHTTPKLPGIRGLAEALFPGIFARVSARLTVRLARNRKALTA